MQQALQSRTFEYHYQPVYSDDHIVCDWTALREQLLHQWERLSPVEMDHAGPHRRKIAQLVERKYGIAAPCIENYLHNFERTMPL
jgi:hypothetical protein